MIKIHEFLALTFGALLLSPTAFAFIVYPLALPGVPTSGVVVAIAALFAIALIFSRTVNMLKMFQLSIVLIYFLIAGVWSESTNYWLSKSIATIVLPPTAFALGIFIAKSRRHLLTFLSIFILFSAIILAKTLVLGLETVSAYSEVQDGNSVGYQSLSRLFGLAAAASFSLMLFRLRILHFGLLSISLCIFIYASINTGGRLGILIVAAFGISFFFFRAPINIRFFALALIACLTLLMVSLDFELELKLVNLSQDPNLPSSMRRILFYLVAQDQDTIIGSRVMLQKLAFSTWQDFPIFGVGWGGFPRHVGLDDIDGLYPHNIIYELLAETGLVGLLMMTGLCALIINNARVHCHDRPSLMVGLSFFSSSIAVSLSISDIPYQRELFISLGILSGLERRAFKLHRWRLTNQI